MYQISQTLIRKLMAAPPYFLAGFVASSCGEREGLMSNKAKKKDSHPYHLYMHT